VVELFISKIKTKPLGGLLMKSIPKKTQQWSSDFWRYD